ncbi:MAG: phosphocholine cytidylyltransferase family protein [Nitrospinae bacterium]|nr:phosphocholine cytidylyltransferase family protein [Nitrospinota bacterium]
MENYYTRENRITTACLLAAGTGSRLHPYTDSVPKCLTEVNGQPILQLLVDGLLDNGFKRLVVVVGHLEHCIRSFLSKNGGGLTIEYVTNPLFQTTNNIYSLWLAEEKIQESSLLIESDLIFDHSLLEDFLYPDKIAISPVQPWMSGTLVSMNNQNRVSAFNMGVNVYNGSMRKSMFKTVNIYSLSWLSWQKVFKRLEVYISNGQVNEYYETVFKEMVANGSLSLEGVFFDPQLWYEIDTAEDLKNAERILDQIEAFNETL